jgi:MSHA biogenesis protein MshO
MMRTKYGFTLLELLVVVAITGILAAVLVVFLRPAIDSYIATQRRASLTDMADTALRRMRQDIRSAVPNSLRTQGASCFQLVPTKGGGRYRMARDINFGTATGSSPLDPSQPTPGGFSMPFDVFNLMRTENRPVLNDWVVISNQNTDDVYNGVNRARVVGVQTPAPAPGGVAVGQHRVYIVPQAFPSGYDAGRFVVVPNATQTLIYNCVGNTLYRTAAPFSATLTATACTSAGTDIVATNVSSCTFVYNPSQGATPQSGFMQMQLTLTDHDESITLMHGVHVENVP